MTEIRKIKQLWTSRSTLEGAGVKLKRAFGGQEVPRLDPFLLLDDFHSSNPQDYLAGFPWHPHRGIETITYVLHGTVEHGDSLGNGGVIESGDVQWMTAGSGIIHQEMPKQTNSLLQGFQLWANLPASHKMMNPRYRNITRNEIPTVSLENGVEVKIISGEVNKTKGPVQDIITEPEYLDVTVPKDAEFQHFVPQDHNVFAYVIDGTGQFAPKHTQLVGPEHLIHYGTGDAVAISAEKQSIRFLLISGKPIGEPIAWYGPIVMNTDEELRIAFEEYRKGTFIKYKP
jgi:redox-sensitive bicupin YhaK (pirin superfamily)